MGEDALMRHHLEGTLLHSIHFVMEYIHDYFANQTLHTVFEQEIHMPMEAGGKTRRHSAENL